MSPIVLFIEFVVIYPPSHKQSLPVTDSLGWQPCTRETGAQVCCDCFLYGYINSSPLDKMAAILADDIFNRIFLNENVRIPIQISLKLVPMSPNDNKPSLVQVMV